MWQSIFTHNSLYIVVKFGDTFVKLIRILVSHSGSDWVDPDDPTVIAENELLGAANQIEAAAKKLAALKPRQSARVSANIDAMRSKQ